MKETYVYPLCIQLAAPQNLYDGDFKETLRLLQKHNFYGVEINILDFDSVTSQELTEYLHTFNLKLTMVATGGYAKKNALSLTSPDEKIRTRTVTELTKIIRYASQAGAGAICGFIKGFAGPQKQEASAILQTSLAELDKVVRETKTPLLFEATNHYEAATVNSLADGVQLIKDFKNPYFRILPDTYHMNIEESNTAYAISTYRDYFSSVHLSDNNRYFPGYGAIDFYSILAILKGINFQGSIAIEGNTMDTLDKSIELSSNYLMDVSQRLSFIR